MHPHLSIARPVSDLDRSVAIYCRGLELREIGRFENHAGFDGVMRGNPAVGYHFEFTYCRIHPIHPIAPAPTPEDLVVFCLPDANEWQKACSRMLKSGFKEVTAFNPYWQQRGRTFQDHDNYCIVLE